MNPEDEPYLRLFILAGLGTVMSTVGFILALLRAPEERSRVAVWVWAAFFATASLLAGYCFVRLL